MTPATPSAAEDTTLPAIDRDRALRTLLDLLAIEGTSGREAAVSAEVERRLLAAGCRPSWIGNDRSHHAIGGGFEIGNLIVRMPGSGSLRRAPRRLFSGHLDTVPLCRGAVPRVEGGRIVAAGDTALGGDNRTAVAALVTLVETLLEHELDRAPMTVLLTVGEEVGLKGARHVEPKRLGDPAIGFNVDGGDPTALRIGAIGADRWEADVHGRSAHAGAHPEDGVSAALIASRAVAAVAAKGYFGRVVQGGRQGTSNLGVLRGGEATNQVTDHVYLKGESRSHNVAFLDRITGVWRSELERAAAAVRNDSGTTGRVDFRVERDYEAFRMSRTAPPVLAARSALEALGHEARYEIANGGLDANHLHAKGIPTVTLGAGQHAPHTVDEYIEIGEFHLGCDLLLRLATMAL